VFAVLLAFGAALLFALGTVLQQKGTLEESADANMRADFLARLARQPVWLLGVVTVLAGFGLQALALRLGRLIVVQPIQVTSVVFALPLGVWITSQAVSRREVVGAVLVTGGLIAFVAFADTTGGNDDGTTIAWVVAGTLSAVVCVALVLTTLRSRPAVRAAAVGSASGILFGLSAALTVSVVDAWHGDVVALIADWHLYALIVVSVAAFWLTQIALQNSLELAIATNQALTSAVAVVLAIGLFDEQVRGSPVGALVAVLALLVATYGLYVLLLSERPHSGKNRTL
jgi:drug/metabolite transporter (DMT)-like permease